MSRRQARLGALGLLLLLLPAPALAGGWGAEATGGCDTGLVNESEVCCWPGQGSDGASCLGTPQCPDGTVAAANGSCEQAACAARQVRMPDGQHCCWPGQVWSSSGGACVGDISCPEGTVSSPDGCFTEAELEARRELARKFFFEAELEDRNSRGSKVERVEVWMGVCRVAIAYDYSPWKIDNHCRSNPSAVSLRHWDLGFHAETPATVDYNARGYDQTGVRISGDAYKGYDMKPEHRLYWGNDGREGPRPSSLLLSRCDKTKGNEEGGREFLGGRLFAQVWNEPVKCDLDGDGTKDNASVRECFEHGLEICKATAQP